MTSRSERAPFPVPGGEAHTQAKRPPQRYFDCTPYRVLDYIAALEARCVTLTEAIDSYRRLGDGMVTSAADEEAGTVTEVHTLDALERLHAVLAGSSGGEKP